MTVARDAQAAELLAAAAELDPAERRAFVARAARGDRQLEGEVLSLLAHHESAKGFLATPAVVAAIEATPGDGHARTAQELQAVPGRIASYTIESVLGEGGMGVVYLARQENPNRLVALKVIRHGFAIPRLLKRFEREAELQGRLHHPGIGQIFEAGAAEIGGVSVPFLAMELVRGLPITAYAEHESSSVRARVELFAEVCEAVEHAHRQGVLHRDLKPANILVETSTGRARPKVLDFGIARDAEDAGGSLVTDTGQVVGTLAYMSPEQASGARDAIGARSDLYSLGVILYEMLTGRLPHDVANLPLAQAARRIAEVEPAPPSRFDPRLSKDVDTILAKALAKEPARRYATPAEFASDLRNTLADQPIRARPPSTLYRLEKFARRNRALVVGSSAVFVVLVLGIVSTSTQAVRAAGERDKALAAEEQARKRTEETSAALARESEERAQAEREKIKVQFVSEYFQRLLAEAVPGDRGPDARLVDLLEHATAELPGPLAAVPEAEIGVRATLGQAFEALGRFAEAERELRTALEVVERGVPVDELQRADVRAYLGRVLSKRDLPAEAEPLLAAAHASLTGILGVTHERTVRTALDLGSAQKRLGRTIEAEETLRRALEAARESGCGDGDHVASARRTLGILAFERGALAEAETLQREALERLTARWGEHHPSVLGVTSELANTLVRRDRLEEAEALHRQVVELGARLLGDRHPDQITALNNLASVLVARRSFEEALPLRRRVVELTEEVLGPEHENTWAARENLAVLLAKGLDLGEAEEIHREVLALERERFGTHDRRTLGTLYNLGSVLRDAKRYDEALRTYDELVLAADAALPADDWQRALFRSGRGLCRARAKLPELAEQDFLTSHEEFERLLGPDHARTKNARSFLVQLYDGWGKPEAAERWR